jgi:hypothetical protein
MMRLCAVLLHIGVVAGHRLQQLRRHAPDPGGRRLHRPADVALTLREDVDKGSAVEAQHHRPLDFRIVEGRLVAVDDQVGTGIARRQVADRLGRLALDVLEQRDRDLEREGHVELAAIKARTAVERFGMIVYSIPSR